MTNTKRALDITTQLALSIAQLSNVDDDDVKHCVLMDIRLAKAQAENALIAIIQWESELNEKS